MGSRAERAVHQAVHAVLDADDRLAEAVLSEEDAVNEMQIEIDDRVQRLFALRAPMAIDLRFLLAVSRINGDLERVADQAVNIAQSALRMLRHPQVKPYVDLPRMSELAEGMLRHVFQPVDLDAMVEDVILFFEHTHRGNDLRRGIADRSR